jgi:peptidoglycan/LPS O-acetylase OafA/YrhL
MAGGQAGRRRVKEKAAYRTIDFVRAVAAIAVVWNHCFNMMLPLVRPEDGPIYHLLAITASFGRDAVMVFFVISGYWISRSVSRSVSAGRWSWQIYLLNRLTRLWIVLLPALVLGALCDGVGRFVLDVPPYRALAWQGGGFADVGRNLSVPIFAGNALFLQDLLVPPLGSNSALWTLSKEFWYYIWFPTLVTAWARRPNLIAAAATLWTVYLSGSAALLFACWLAGSIVAGAERRFRTAAPLGRRRSGAVAAAILFWLACAAAARSHPVGYDAGCLLISGGFAMVLACVLRFDVGVPRIVAPLARFGASASFSLYAYHLPVLVVVIALVCGSGTLPLSPVGVLVAAVTCVGLVVGGGLFASLTERHTDRLRAWAEVRLGRRGPHAVAR